MDAVTTNFIENCSRLREKERFSLEEALNHAYFHSALALRKDTSAFAERCKALFHYQEIEKVTALKNSMTMTQRHQQFDPAQPIV